MKQAMNAKTKNLAALNIILIPLMLFAACDFEDIDDTIKIPKDLGKMDESGSGWHRLLADIEAKKKPVKLNLSKCAMYGTEFNPDNAISEGKSYIVSITLPDAAESISAGSVSEPSFKYFSRLKNVYSNNLTAVGTAAFLGCGALKSVNFPAVQNIGSFSFRNCTSIASVDLPEAKIIPEYAFEYCASLARVNIPSAARIDNYSFYQCDALTEITVKGGALTGSMIDLLNQSDRFKAFHECYLANTQGGRAETYVLGSDGWEMVF
jgi:hypothetical protein